MNDATILAEHEATVESTAEGRSPSVRVLAKPPTVAKAPAAEPLSARSASYMATAGIVIFALNMIAGWSIAFFSWAFVAQPLGADRSSVTREAMHGIANGVDPNVATFMTRIVESEVHLKAVANKQSLVMVAMAGGFGLFALGFSLFIMGLRGAIELSGGKPDVGPIVLRSTSPGLVCFVLGAVLIGYGVSRETSMNFGEVSYLPTDARVTAPLPPLSGPPLPGVDKAKLDAIFNNPSGK
jgi:hypothetical protein